MSSVARPAEGGEEKGGNGVGVLEGGLYIIGLNTVCIWVCMYLCVVCVSRK